jgi:hypothetical protein
VAQLFEEQLADLKNMKAKAAA